jgi:hypothetical protein
MFIDDSFNFERFRFLETIVVEVITYQLISQWFQTKQTLKQSDTNNIAFTVKRELGNDKYLVCQGIFNTESQELLYGIKWQSSQIDTKITNIHKNNPLVVYN